LLSKGYTFWRTPKETGQRDRGATVGVRFNSSPHEQPIGEQE
jgi:hypothetical protein